MQIPGGISRNVTYQLFSNFLVWQIYEAGVRYYLVLQNSTISGPNGSVADESGMPDHFQFVLQAQGGWSEKPRGW